MTPAHLRDRLRGERPSARVVAATLLGPLLGALVVLAVVGTSPIVQRADLATPLPAPGQLVVIGAPGLAWSDISEEETPALWTLFRDGASAAQTVRSVNETACPTDGWLSLSAGQRAAEAGSAQVCGPDPAPSREEEPATPGSPARLTQWPDWLRTAAEGTMGAEPGLLGEALQDRDICVHAHGAGAAIAAADRRGRVPRYTDITGSDAQPLRLDDCTVEIVDAGSIRDHFEENPEAGRLDRQRQVRQLDEWVAEVLDQAAEDATVIVTGLADSGQTPQLRLLTVHGPQVRPGTLVSTSTRQPGLVQTSDVTAAILDVFGIAVPDAVSGTPLRTIVDPALAGDEPRSATLAALDRLQERVDTGEAAREVHPLPAPFFVTWGVLQIAAYVRGAQRLRRADDHGDRAARESALRWLARSATVAAAVPVATFLANLLPWWRSPVPLLAVFAAAGLFTVAVVAVALLGPWRHARLGPIAAVMALTVVVLAADVMTGSSLQTSSLMGLQPVLAGRFYGMGNVTFALFATATLLLVTCVASLLVAARDRVLAAAAIAVVGTAAVLVNGLPVWGADFGGPPALAPAVIYLVLAALGIRLSWQRVVLIAVATVALLAAMSLLDWLRPPGTRTHLGNFVQEVLDGEAGVIVWRKLEQNLGILFSTPLTMLVPVLLAAAVWVVARPGSGPGRRLARITARAPLLREGLVALLACWVIGFALNDSGTAIPPAGLTLAVPAVIASAARTATPHVPAGAPAPAPAGGRNDRTRSPVR